MAESREAVPIAIWRVSGSRAPLPRYMTEGASGCDLAAAIDEEIVLEPLGRALVPTGLAIALPDGFEAQVRPRSGLAVREGITVLNAPGTIDADYRGEIKVVLVNLGSERRRIEPGERIAQIGARHDAHHPCHVLDRARHHAGRGELAPGAGGKHRDAAVRRLQPDYTGKIGRRARRAAAVGGKRQRSHAGGERGGRSAARSTWRHG